MNTQYYSLSTPTTHISEHARMLPSYTTWWHRDPFDHLDDRMWATQQHVALRGQPSVWSYSTHLLQRQFWQQQEDSHSHQSQQQEEGCPLQIAVRTPINVSLITSTTCLGYRLLPGKDTRTITIQSLPTHFLSNDFVYFSNETLVLSHTRLRNLNVRQCGHGNHHPYRNHDEQSHDGQFRNEWTHY